MSALHVATASIAFCKRHQSIPGGYEPASQNLHRLEETEASGAAQRDVALGNHAQFIEDICV